MTVSIAADRQARTHHRPIARRSLGSASQSAIAHPGCFIVLKSNRQGRQGRQVQDRTTRCTPYADQELPPDAMSFLVGESELSTQVEYRSAFGRRAAGDSVEALLLRGAELSSTLGDVEWN